MRALILCAVAASISACGAADCDKTDRTGSYLTTSETLGGDCGDLDPTVAQWTNGGGTTSPGCTINYSRWSDDQCTFESSLTCTSQADGFVATGVVVTTQEDDEGELISGTMSMTIRDYASNALLCTGTYEITYERQ